MIIIITIIIDMFDVAYIMSILQDQWEMPETKKRTMIINNNDK